MPAAKPVSTVLNCPFCDEESKPCKKKYSLYTQQKNYILRECIMGHQFWSVEYIPEDQSEVAKEVKEIRAIWHTRELEKAGMEIKAASTRRKNTSQKSS